VNNHLRALAKNEGILLANLLQSSTSTFSRGSFLSFFAFKEGMLGTPISVRRGWPTVSRGINENASKCFYRCRNVGERLSSCHLNKQRLIDPLEAEVNESVWLIESMGVTPPYKISRFHRESLWAPGSSGMDAVTAAPHLIESPVTKLGMACKAHAMAVPMHRQECRGREACEEALNGLESA
jgi:hypothetical protein